MKVILVVVLLIAVLLLLGIIAIAALRRVSPARELIREYNQQVALAAKHTRRGHDGEANVHLEAAERLIHLIQDSKESNRD